MRIGCARSLALALAALSLPACDGTATSTDASVRDAPDFTIAPPALPFAPMPPRVTCPSGWTAMQPTDGPATCDPWPAGRPGCADGTRLAAGGCVPLATDCAVVPPEVASGAAYVLTGSTGGDGSIAHPFGTIDEAIASGAPVIALGAGTYALPTRVANETIVGACPTTTTLEVSASSHLAEVTLRRMRITGTGGLVGGVGALLTLDAIEITSLSAGVQIGGSLTASRIDMRDVHAGLAASGPGHIDLTDVSIERVDGPGIAIDGATSVSLTRTIVADVRTVDVEVAAILLGGIATFTGEALVVEQTQGHGLALSAHQITLHHALFRHIAGGACLLESPVPNDTTPLVSSEIWVADAGAGLVLSDGFHTTSDLVVVGVQNIGVTVFRARGTLDRIWVEQAMTDGVDVDSSAVTVSDLFVRHVRASDRITGGAMIVEDGAYLTLARARFADTDHYGLAVTTDATRTLPAHVDASDVEISDVASITQDDGFGVVANERATLTLTRAFIHDVLTAGIAAQSGTVTATDLTIRSVHSVDGLNGIGASATVDPGDPPAGLAFRRADISDVVRWGVLATGPGAVLDATDLFVHETHAASEGEGGGAVVLSDRALAHVVRFAASGSEQAGFIATHDVTVALELGRIEDNQIGMIVSPALVAGGRLSTRGVIVRRNQVDQQATETTVMPPAIVLR